MRDGYRDHDCGVCPDVSLAIRGVEIMKWLLIVYTINGVVFHNFDGEFDCKTAASIVRLMDMNHSLDDAKSPHQVYETSCIPLVGPGVHVKDYGND